MNEQELHYFKRLHQEMPRQGPGNEACTLRALLAIRTDIRTVLDLGCGPAQQTVHLAMALPGATIDAFDLWPVMVAEATDNIEAHHLQDRVTVQQGDMANPPAKTFDLIWSEGAAYNMGVEEALKSWGQHLNEGGHIALTDAVWLKDEVPSELAEFWQEYPDMASQAQRIQQAEALQYSLVTDFVLPPSAWLDDYYGPLQARINAFRTEASGNPAFTAVLDAAQLEIDLFEQYSDCYGYAFFVWQRRNS